MHSLQIFIWRRETILSLGHKLSTPVTKGRNILVIANSYCCFFCNLVFVNTVGEGGPTNKSQVTLARIKQVKLSPCSRSSTSRVKSYEILICLLQFSHLNLLEDSSCKSCMSGTPNHHRCWSVFVFGKDNPHVHFPQEPAEIWTNHKWHFSR